MKFPLALEAFQPLKLDMDQKELSMEQEKILKANIQLCRDAIVFFTAVAEAKGLGGHTGGAYDVVPEVLIADGFVSGSDRFFPVYFDEAGHRVALQYLIAVLHRHLPADALLHYREFGFKLPGHPERHFTPGIDFSSGRLGHLWPYVNGVALANPQKIIFLLGSDGSQQEGNEAEAARFAVSQKLSV
ncbi:MAG: transketolase, partial [Planctomycetota bacterium]